MSFLSCGGRLSSTASKGAPSYPAPTPRGGVSPWKARTQPQPSPQKNHHRFHRHTSRRRSPTHSSQLARRRRRSAIVPAPEPTDTEEEEEASEEEESEEAPDEFYVAATAAALSQPSAPSLPVSGVSGGVATKSPRAGHQHSSCTSPRFSSPAVEATVAGLRRSSRPPTPPSILIGRSAVSPAESSACRRFPFTPPPPPTQTSLSPPVPSLSLDRAHVPALNFDDVRMSAERRNLLEQQQMYQPPPQQQQQRLGEGQRSPALVSPASLRSVGSTSQVTNGVVDQTVGDNAAAAATEASSCGTSHRGSVRFVHPRGDTAKTVAATAAFLCAGVSTPRNCTPRYRNAEVGKPSGSLLLDQSAPFSNGTDTPSPHYKDVTAAAGAAASEEEGAERNSGFVPLSFTPSSREGTAARRRRSSTSGALLHSFPGPLSPSAPSFPSPASILLKSATILSPTSNGATIDTNNTSAAASCTSRPFHPSWSTSERSGSRTGCRRGRCECPPGAPERCRHASSFSPHFVEEDSSQRQLCRRDSCTSSSSDDERTLEMVRSTILRLHQRDSAAANQSGSELLSVMRKRVASTLRRSEE